MSEETWWVIKDRDGMAMAGSLARGPGEAWALFIEGVEADMPMPSAVRVMEEDGMHAAPVHLVSADLPSPDPEDQTSLTCQGGPAPTS